MLPYWKEVQRFLAVTRFWGKAPYDHVLPLGVAKRISTIGYGFAATQ